MEAGWDDEPPDISKRRGNEILNRLRIALGAALLLTSWGGAIHAKSLKIDGYRPIWFDLGQSNEYGSKYSGGLGTYTAKHRPMAIYSPKANKTFFVYGGTTDARERHLLAMVSYYDHATGLVPKPTLVHDKEGVTDPHDNPSLGMDDQGYLWVFVSGRARNRMGYVYRSVKPYEIDDFERLSKEEFTYPQPVWIPEKGFVFTFTRYTNGRELYWNTYDAKRDSWSEVRQLAGMGGHYQITEAKNGKVITAFNMHPDGIVDKRTNLYYLQTTDFGQTWQTIQGETIVPPLTDPHCSARVRDYRSEGRLVYLKDIAFDSEDRPVILYLTSAFHQPGPEGDPRIWTLAHWTGGEWRFHEVTQSTHNYDMGSLYIEADGTWNILAPTEPGPQYHGAGGEVALWTSSNQGINWMKVRNVTHRSDRNHNYVRRPVNAHPDFHAFWADGDPDRFSISYLYFTNRSGTGVWQLPYEMREDFVAPCLLTPVQRK